MKELVTYLAQSLVDEPEAVVVQSSQLRGFVTLTLQVSPKDMGRIIGKDGRIISAMRSLVRVAAIKQSKKATLEVR